MCPNKRKNNLAIVASLALMGASSIYSPYVDEFFYTKEKRSSIRKSKSLTKSQRELFIKHKPLAKFMINGHEIMAYSRKDAIKRLKHQKRK